jgi:acyl carrier protein
VSVDIEEAIMKYVVDVQLDGDGRDFSPDTDLIANAILDSFGALQLVLFLNSTFDINIPLGQINASNLRTVTRMAALVRQHLVRGGDKANG